MLIKTNRYRTFFRPVLKIEYFYTKVAAELGVPTDVVRTVYEDYTSRLLETVDTVNPEVIKFPGLGSIRFNKNRAIHVMKLLMKQLDDVTIYYKKNNYVRYEKTEVRCKLFFKVIACINKYGENDLNKHSSCGLKPLRESLEKKFKFWSPLAKSKVPKDHKPCPNFEKFKEILLDNDKGISLFGTAWYRECEKYPRWMVDILDLPDTAEDDEVYNSRKGKYL